MRNSAEVLRKLFRWQSSFELEARDGEKITINQRIVSEFQQGDAQKQALYNGALYRERLRDPESFDSKAFLQAMMDADVETMIPLVLVSTLSEAQTQFEATTQKRTITPPGEYAKQEAHEKYEKDLEERDKEYELRRVEYVDKYLMRKKEQLEKLPKEKLVGLYREALIDRLVQQQVGQEVRERIIAASCYLDEDYQNPLFNTYEQFRDYSPDVKNIIAEKYRELERVSTQEIKN